MYLLVTNNKRCLEELKDRVRVEFLEKGSYLDVLLKVRDYIQNQYILETHPMAGSIKPNQTPYRSVLVSDRKTGQEEWLEGELMIEDAILQTEKFLHDRPTRTWTETMLEDFRQVDLDLIRNAINRAV